MEITLPYAYIRCIGPEGLLRALQILFPYLGLYSVSTGWTQSPEYIAKARGVGGDVLVFWYEEVR